MSSPSRSTGFGDGVRTGPQVNSRYDNGLPGAPSSPVFVYDFIPQPASFTNVAPLQTPASAGYLTLVNSGNSGTNTVVLKNFTTFVQFDSPRRIQVIGVSATTLAQLFIYGEDTWGNLVTEQLSGPVGATIVTSNKVYSGIYRIYTSAGTTGNISIGCADAFGIPYVAMSRNYITPYFGGYIDNLINSNSSTYLGSTTLAAGTKVVTLPSIAANSIVFASYSGSIAATNPGYLSVPSASIIPGVGFTINSSNASDTSTVNYRIESPSYVSGTAKLVVSGGVSSVVVPNTNIAATDSVEITYNTPSGASAPGLLTYTITAGVGFTVTSSVATDTSTFNYHIRKASLYVGNATLGTGGTVTVPSFVVTANSKILLSERTSSGVTGFLTQGTLTAGTSFVINSSATTDRSTVDYYILNPIAPGYFVLADLTTPATITSGDPRGVYVPGQPSDGASHLTIYMYDRGVNNAAATFGGNPNDTLQYNNSANLWGVDPYTDTNH